MTFELVFLDAVDPSLGRVDLESLPQQALMEMVIEGITNKEKICGDADEPKDIEEWKGVSIEDGQVVEIEWKICKLEGSFHFEWLPISVRKFSVGWNHKITGTLNCASLPTFMKMLDIQCNYITGLIHLESLPEGMEKINISENELSGSLKLHSLPDTLTHFRADWNEFTGSVDLTQLPAGMLYLDLRSNRLSGSVVLTQLPNNLIELYLSNTQFSGALDLTRVPSSMCRLYLDNNSFL
ncbi:leucine-rich repeat protein [Perkinsela sp. CCAP 1560/4]|nr:leucine-rich repeat protein [Perkinsela sp. CCAP 1560/4]|eukprot:KNH03672.1 leucine-rich repeat protein [Perkinsela sp. CCAP 1560/4]